MLTYTYLRCISLVELERGLIQEFLVPIRGKEKPSLCLCLTEANKLNSASVNEQNVTLPNVSATEHGHH